MALYLKQDFTPPILSKKWIAMKFRPNMLIYSHHHIIAILESGLLFREDSIELEQESPSPDTIWRAAGGAKSGWFTMGEKLATICSVGTCIAMFPPRSVSRSSLLLVASYFLLPLSIRILHRHACRGTLATLLGRMRDYLALARRAAACLRDCTQLHHQLNSFSSVLESMHTILCRQQSELAVIMSRASSALLGNAPWLRSDVAWHAVQRDETDNLLKIHHAFLVVQSTLLKHIAMAHYMPTTHAQKIYKNHNERIYWIHTTLIQNLIVAFTDNYEALERMYRLLKNYGSNDNMVNKKMGHAMTDTWLYSDVHSGIAKVNLELKLAQNRCNNLDNFLDSCALNKQEIDLKILNKDIDILIDNISKCLITAQSSQIRLKKLQNKFATGDNEAHNHEDFTENEREILTIEDREPETKDEVFYFVKTDDDDVDIQLSGDVTTEPGKKEKEATKIVLNELRRKLVKREDLMRERERQALVKTMPELKDNVPEFPRQIKIEEVMDRKGFISKLPKQIPKKRIFRKYKIQSPHVKKAPKYRLKVSKYEKECDIQTPLYEANSNLNAKSRFLTFFKDNNFTYITKWFKRIQTGETANKEIFSDLSEGLSDVESSAVNKTVHQAVNHRLNNGEGESCQNDHRQRNGEAKNYKFSKKELELTPSSSESDLELILNDVRRYRAARKKNFPLKKGILTVDKTVDESLRPIEYSLGAGLAMASVLQAGRAALLREEVFIGDGEVSEDSGNDEDA